jgi:DNA-binding CsgD family transcriptional regulator
VVTPVTRPPPASPTMVGRAAELRALVEMGASLHPGRPPVALVAGRAGMGKTRLVDVAAKRWADAGIRVLSGSCRATDGPPYLPLAGALRRALPATAPVLRRLAEGPVASRLELFEMLSAAVASLSAHRPLLLVVEDLHWSDRATREALAWLASERVQDTWGLVITHRYEGPLTPAQLATFTDALGRRPLTRISLDPLTPGEVAELAGAIRGTRPDTEAALLLHRRTGGIPLLVEEVLAAGEAGVPDHLRTVFRGRMVAAGPEVVAALGVVAVAGECDELVVGEALGVDASTVARAMRRAEEDDLVEVGRHGYRFRHDLLREAAYDDLPPGRRRELHGLVATSLAARHGIDPAVLLDHWARAGVTHEVVRTGLAAATEAERLHAPADAHRHFERVLEAWSEAGDDVRRRCPPYDEVLARAALAAERSGAFDRAVALTEQRIALGGDAETQAVRWERLARYRWEGGDGNGSGAAYAESLRVLPETATDPVRARVLAGVAWHKAASFRYAEAQPVADRAMAACHIVEDPSVLWQAHLALGIAHLGTDQGHAALEEACRLGTVTGISEEVAIARMWLNLSAQRRPESRQREPNLRAGLRVASAAGLHRSMAAALRYMLSAFLMECGRWDEADDVLAHNLHLEVSGIPAFFTWAYVTRLAAWRGDDVRAATALAETRRLAELVPQQPLPLALALIGEAEGLVWRGEPGRAVAVARDAVELAGVDPLERQECLLVLCRAEAAMAEGEAGMAGRARAAELRALLGPGAGGTTAPRSRASEATCQAELARIGGAHDPDAWRDAAQAWEAAGDPYQAALVGFQLSRELARERAGRSAAAAELARARAAALRLGARPLAEAIDRFGRRVRLPVEGIPVRAAAAGAVAAALSVREQEVLELMSRGRTNADIAEALVVSPRTVGTHVSSILRKLGAARRTEAVDLARRAGLLDS